MPSLRRRRMEPNHYPSFWQPLISQSACAYSSLVSRLIALDHRPCVSPCPASNPEKEIGSRLGFELVWRGTKQTWKGTRTFLRKGRVTGGEGARDTGYNTARNQMTLFCCRLDF